MRPSFGEGTARRLESISRAGLLGLILLAPLPFGAVVGWAWSGFAVALGGLLALSGLARVLVPRPLPRATRDVGIGFALLALPAVLQLVPLPARLVAALSPATRDLYSAMAPAAAWMPLSQDSHATLSALVWGAACAAAAVLVTLLFEGRRLSMLLATLVTLGALQAFYGLVEFLSGRQRILAYTKVYYTDSVTGTYINRNHFAGLLLLVLPLAAAWLITRARRLSGAAPRRQGTRRLLALADPGAGPATLLALAVCLMVAGLTLSFSRAGAFLGAVAAIALVAILRPFRPRVMIAAVLLAIFGLVPLMVRGPGRLAEVGSSLPAELVASSGRLAVWTAALPMLLDHSVIGTGLGTFAEAWSRYRPAAVRLAYDHAHQDYLEWAVETGLPGVLLLGVVAVVFVRRSRQAMRVAASNADRVIVQGLLIGLLALALHGLVDFNAHIPANLLLAAIAAAACSWSPGPGPPGWSWSRPRPSARRAAAGRC